MSLMTHIPRVSHLPQVHMPHVPHVHMPHVQMPHLPDPKHPYYPRTYEFLENGCMSREMDRL
jgi:hypothetical protein